LSERSEAAPRRRRNERGFWVTEVRAEITANVWQVRTEVGAAVVEGDELIILESMKMEIPVVAPSEGTVTEVRVEPESKVQEGDVVVVLDP
jgi:biotin carboxyl carrier protein